MIGNLITWTEKIIRRFLSKIECINRKRCERTAGAILVLVILMISMAVPALLLFFAYRMAWQIGIGLETFMCYQILAVKSLKTESDNVYTALEKQGLEAGRQAVSMIVGRDTEKLTEEGVIKAAVETVAENISDGIAAPLFYMAAGGAVLAFGYKAINTMDSMIGYKNEKYQYFGTAAARLDDIVNYIPARLAAWLMIAAAYLAEHINGGRNAQYNGRNAVRIYLRDRRNHKSPNSAQTESVMAGALGIELAGNAYYFGKLHEKPTIGDACRDVEAQDIRRSHRLLYMTAWLTLILLCVVKAVIVLLALG